MESMQQAGQTFKKAILVTWQWWQQRGVDKIKMYLGHATDRI